MEGRIVDVKRFAVHDGPGIRTTIFFKGCPLHCTWCHNPESISPSPQFGFIPDKCIGCGECRKVCPNERDTDKCVFCGKCAEACLGQALQFYGALRSSEELIATVLEDKLFYQTSGGGMTLSGGEPLLQPEFARELLELAKENGIHTAVDTCGHVGHRALDMVKPLTDIFLYDLKHTDPTAHRKLTGCDNRLILENLCALDDDGCKIEVRIPLIPTLNDSEDNLRASGELLASLKNLTLTRVLPYHDYARSKYRSLGMEDTMPHVELPDDESLNRAVDILRSYGVNAKSGRE